MLPPASLEIPLLMVLQKLTGQAESKKNIYFLSIKRIKTYWNRIEPGQASLLV
jgi:hypothetical protein